MSNLYDALIALLQAHWKSHNNAYPLRIELTAGDMQLLNDERRLVNESMNFKQSAGWENHFHGAQLQVGAVSCLVDIDGKAIPVRYATGDAAGGLEGAAESNSSGA